ncbi:kinesin-like protein [Volvox carteri f. nagariensis]|uniref:Kinesin-like protein n=1 Tax=Volvox carteri f. nagariensis TaxID=3068 RepID=D8TUB8_VOLCA|nr:kinesin-like protein [Volvox carteri f. nagariensis]EFJ49115.1 kinesin-like protein [Volvox carteri f. nagariensis]|eukprot:XP_002950012.1 kinesin-like protein [Volvox carteri f. nagariensis]
MAFMQAGMSAEALAAAAELDVPPGKYQVIKAVISDMIEPDSLPPGWEARYDAAMVRREYVNKDTGEVQYKHPLLSYYRGAAFMELGGSQQLQGNEEEQPPAPQEILDMCAYLGINPSQDDPYILEVARLAISAPLPAHWVEAEDDDGNPMFTNQQTGESQPSHPLDPYFVEMIKRRRRELLVRSDGVGIRSALAAKRLHEIGVPGITVPPELLEDVAGSRRQEEEEEEEASGAGRNFGPLVTIEETEEEGHDDEDHTHKPGKQPQQPPQQQMQKPLQLQPQVQQKQKQKQESQRSLMLEDFEGEEEDGDEEEEEKARAAAEYDDEDAALAALRAQAAEAARRAAAAVAEFDAKFPPLPVLLNDSSGGGGDLRRSRSYTEVETGRLMKQISAIEAARSALTTAAASDVPTAAAASAAGSIYAVARLPSGRLDLLRSRVYGSSGVASAAAAAAVAAAAADSAPPSRNPAREPSRERIRVAVRARPVPKPGEPDAWLIDPVSRTVRLKENAASATHRHISADRVYCFDLVLSPDSSTKQLWASHVVPLMDASLGGINTTVFAYGQTGSGKTYTMFGSDGRLEDGAIAMSLSYLFKALKVAGWGGSLGGGGAGDGGGGGPIVVSRALRKLKGGAEEYTVKISMLELYNEQLRDLLAPGGGPFDRLGRPSGAPLALQDDPRVGVRVSGLDEHAVADVPAAMALVARGAMSRSVGSTAMNEVSSRSHTIVRLALETREATTRELVHTSLVSFVDLAGSERLAKTGSSGTRFVEGTNINISLLMLGTVVSKLAEGRTGEFIPYRNSKLTRLLQPCLGGNSKTAIIATINPSVDHVEETFNTLAFATRAMDVVNQVSVNSYIRGSGAVGGALSGAAAAALQKQVATLKAELAALKKEAGGAGGLGSGTALLLGPDGGGANAAALMAERLARLEIDKARLLDRLEALTGRAQGDVYDDLPPTPPDLHLPPPRPPGRSGSSGSLAAAGTTPSLALRSIARLACVGRAGGGGGAVGGSPSKSLIPRPNEQIPPEEVVVAVRGMRDERDELRRRDLKLRRNLEEAHERLAEVEPYRVLAEQVKEVVGMLENILGPSPVAVAGADRDLDSDPATAACNQAARLAENVQAVAMMHNELLALQQQLATSEAVAAAAARRAGSAETALQRAAVTAAEDWMATGDGGDARLKNMVEQLNSQLTAVRRELDVTKSELAKWRGLAAEAPEVGEPGAADGGDGDVDDVYGDDDGEGEASRQPAKRLASAASLNVGSFAIRKAREAMVQASSLEARCNAAEAERDELRERLQALEEAVAAGGVGGRGLLQPPGGGRGGGYGSTAVRQCFRKGGLR